MPAEFAEKLQAARDARAMVGERRIVTMLFCDVKGSTAAAERLDPEEWTDIMNGAFEPMIGPVYKYEGTVARLMGDAILAFFGAPIAHEDDPERAIRAALEIVEGIKPYREVIKRDWGFDFDVRVGINTGLVVVGPVGSDLRMEYTALGDAVNLAARMEQTATPGSVQIAEPTHKLAAALFDFEKLGAIQVKGKDEPVLAYRALRPKAQQRRMRGIEGLESPLVGREAEMTALRSALVELSLGRGQVVSIMGEAGLGKSRLMAELRGQPPAASGEAGDTEAFQWLEGRCLSYQTTTPYAPFVDLLRSHFGFGDEPANADLYARLGAGVARAAPSQVDDIGPYLATLFGLPLSGAAFDRVRYLEPPQLRARVQQALVDYLESLCRARSVVLVLDDLHWADPSSLNLLESMLPMVQRARLMLVAMFRPQRQDAAWHFHEIAERDYAQQYQALMLKPLDEGDARQLVANLLHIEDLPEKVRQLILKKAEGNPFFVEEVIRSLLDSGLVVQDAGHWRATREIENIAVPDTLAAVINARLDRLGDEARGVAQSAAVIGRQFSMDLLGAVHPPRQALDEPLSTLQRRELVREKTRLPERVYLFKHALTQETAYNSLLLKTRRELHLKIAGVLEQSAPEQVNDLAYHFLAARQPARALPFLLVAGDRAAKAYATPEAIGFYQQALEILQTLDDVARLRHVYEGLGNAFTFANRMPEAIETLRAMLAAAEKAGDVPMQVSALNKLSYIFALRMGQFKEADEYLSEADRRARGSQDKPGLSEMGLIRCMMCTFVADFDGVVRYMDETLGLGRELGVKEQETLAMTHIASSQTYMLLFDKAFENYEAGLRLCREIGDRQHEAELMSFTGPMCYLVRGDIRSARRVAEEGLSVGMQIGDLNATIDSSRMLGYFAHQQGDYEHAIEYYQRYLDNGRAAQYPWVVAEALCFLGTAYLDISPALSERVFGFHGQALQVLEQPAGALMGATAWGEIGFCLDAVGQLEKAGEYFQKGLTIPTVMSQLERPRLLVGSGLVNLKLGNVDQAGQQVAEANTVAVAKGMQFIYPLVAYAEGCVAEARGDPAGALAALERAERMALEMEMRPIMWQSRAKAARALAALGQMAEAEGKRAAAQMIVDEIGGLFSDADLREKFLDQAGRAIA
jgi:class 3 adenylate cyclase